MIIKVGDSFGAGNAPAAGNSSAGAAGAGSRSSGAGAASGAAADQVSLTDQANRLQALEKTVLAMSDVDDSRVAAVRAQLDRNAYVIDPADVAAKLIDFETALYGR